jgi:hypothetical protein
MADVWLSYVGRLVHLFPDFKIKHYNSLCNIIFHALLIIYYTTSDQREKKTIQKHRKLR